VLTAIAIVVAAAVLRSPRPAEAESGEIAEGAYAEAA
jgi:hypothetical protein